MSRAAGGLTLLALLVALSLAACSSAGQPAPGSQPMTGASAPPPVDLKAVELVRDAADRMRAAGLTMHVAGRSTYQTKVAGVSKKDWLDTTVVNEGDRVMPDKMRMTATVTAADGSRTGSEILTVDGGVTAFTRAPGAAQWQRQTLGSVSTAADPLRILATLSAARGVVVTRTERVAGVACEVVEIRFDPALLNSADRSSGLAQKVGQALSVDPANVTAVLAAAAGMRVLWIGKKDHLVYRDRQAIVAGGQGALYREIVQYVYSAFGRPVVPPIVAPTGLK